MIDLFTELARLSGQTVLMVTHSLDVARTADRVMQLIDGQLVLSDLAGESGVAW